MRPYGKLAGPGSFSSVKSLPAGHEGAQWQTHQNAIKLWNGTQCGNGFHLLGGSISAPRRARVLGQLFYNGFYLFSCCRSDFLGGGCYFKTLLDGKERSGLGSQGAPGPGVPLPAAPQTEIGFVQGRSGCVVTTGTPDAQGRGGHFQLPWEGGEVTIGSIQLQTTASVGGPHLSWLNLGTEGDKNTETDPCALWTGSYVLFLFPSKSVCELLYVRLNSNELECLLFVGLTTLYFPLQVSYLHNILRSGPFQNCSKIREKSWWKDQCGPSIQ